MLRLSLAALSIFLLASCDQNKPPPSKEYQRFQRYLDPLPPDAPSAVSTLLSRLVGAVSRQGNLLVIQDHSIADVPIETDVLPISAPWTVKCGVAGVDVTFGNSASTDGSDAMVTLSMASVTDPAKCALYGIAIGTALENITGHT